MDDTPRYQKFVRSEARLRDDQAADLATLRRRVAANRENRSERITDNTMLRLAVDLLLQNGHRITGDTEEQMRRSLLGAGEDTPRRS